MCKKRKFEDLTGKKFGRLTVVEFSKIDEKGQFCWKCKCECGNIKLVDSLKLKNNKVKSCGCLQKDVLKELRTKHGYANKEKLYSVWKNMKDRCYRDKNKSYKNYGGRGITVCDEWKYDYNSFRKFCYENGYDPEKPFQECTIDRIDNDGNYEPNNCRIVSNKVQAKNKRKPAPKEKRKRYCAICGKEFYSKCLETKCCSTKCGDIHRSNTVKEKNKDKHKKICPICGKEFEDKSGHFNRRITCSKRCANIKLSPIWEHEGKSLRVVEWGELLNISAHCLLHRHKDMGWSIEKTLSTPLKRRNNGL